MSQRRWQCRCCRQDNKHIVHATTHACALSLWSAGDGNGQRGSIVVSNGGTLSLHGLPKRSWTRLAAGAPALQGERSIVVEGPLPGWQVGDSLAIAPTDFYHDQGEQRRITSITPKAGGSYELQLDMHLVYNHNGERYSVLHRGKRAMMELDARAEVAVLTRWDLRLAHGASGAGSACSQASGCERPPSYGRTASIQAAVLQASSVHRVLSRAVVAMSLD